MSHPSDMPPPPPPRLPHDLASLTARIDPQFIKDPPQGKHGKYVGHDDITQMALAKVGPFDFEVVEVVRGFIPEKTTQSGKTYAERPHGIVAALCRLTVTIDGRVTTIQETGEANSPDIRSDGENLKTAGSDGLKRCFMRVGLGLELWIEQGQNPSVYHLPGIMAGRMSVDEVEADGEQNEETT